MGDAVENQEIETDQFCFSNDGEMPDFKVIWEKSFKGSGKDTRRTPGIFVDCCGLFFTILST
jgi:hypothetical protein